MCTVSRNQLYFERRHKHSRPYEIFTRCRRGHKDLLYAKCGRSDARFHRQVALKKNLKTQFFPQPLQISPRFFRHYVPLWGPYPMQSRVGGFFPPFGGEIPPTKNSCRGTLRFFEGPWISLNF